MYICLDVGNGQSLLYEISGRRCAPARLLPHSRPHALVGIIITSLQLFLYAPGQRCWQRQQPCCNCTWASAAGRLALRRHCSGRCCERRRRRRGRGGGGWCSTRVGTRAARPHGTSATAAAAAATAACFAAHKDRVDVEPWYIDDLRPRRPGLRHHDLHARMAERMHHVLHQSPFARAPCQVRADTSMTLPTEVRTLQDSAPLMHTVEG